MAVIKLLRKVRQMGLRGSLSMIPVRFRKKILFCRPFHRAEMRRRMERLMNKSGKPQAVLLVENHFGYGRILMQRPQHLAKALAGPDMLVFYNSFYPMDYRDSKRIERIGKQTYVLDFYYYRDALFDVLSRLPVKKYVMIYSTDTVRTELLQKYRERGFGILYEYVDEIDEHLMSPQAVGIAKKRHRWLLGQKDVFTAATSGRLYEQLLSRHPAGPCALIPNGADYRRFREAVPAKIPEFRKGAGEKLIIGYYGALASWVDYELLKDVAKDGRYRLVLIGSCHDGSLEQSGIGKLPEVYVLQAMPYEELPGCAKWFDICIIPFRVNEITLAVSPVKLFEYMALGKPIVTTALPECTAFESVLASRGAREFLENLERARMLRENEEYQKLLEREARQNTWQARAKQWREFLKLPVTGKAEGMRRDPK